jgi:hypothetical protein
LFVSSSDGGEFRLAAFSADVTVPIGHGMMGGSWKAASDLPEPGTPLMMYKMPRYPSGTTCCASLSRNQFLNSIFNFYRTLHRKVVSVQASAVITHDGETDAFDSLLVILDSFLD